MSELQQGLIPASRDPAETESLPPGRELRVLNESEWPAWDRFVFAHPKASVQQSSIWLRSLDGSFPHMRSEVLALVDIESNEILGGIPYCEVRSRIFKNRLISVPHATLCPPLVKGGATELGALLDAVVKRGLDHDCRRIGLRWTDSDQLPPGWGEQFSIRETTYFHHYFDLSKPRELIWRALSRRIRRPIKNAEMAGVSVVQAKTRAEVDAFHHLLSGTRRRLGLPTQPRQFLQDIWDGLGDSHRILWLAKAGEKTVGGVFGTMAGSMLAMDSYGEMAAMRGLGVNSLLYWRALCHAQDQGFERISFGRTGISNEGLLNYKRHWKGVEEQLVYRDICTGGGEFSSQAGGCTRENMQIVLRHLPPFLYRPVSELFYRHWA